MLASAPIAGAQGLPPSTEPGRVQQRVQPPPAAPRAPPGIVIPPSVQPKAPPGAENITFVLSKVVIDGSTVYREADLLALYRKLLGTRITLTQLFGIASAITNKYRNDGYVLSQAVVPAQEITEGVVHIRVVEGFVDQVVVQGKAARGDDLIRAYADKIAASRPLRESDLERYLLLANDLPGISTRAILTPSPTTPGAANLTLIVTRKLVDGFASVDNRGTKFEGPIQVTAGVNANSPLGINDRWGLLYQVTPSGLALQYIQGSYAQPIGYEGTLFSAIFAQTFTQPGFTLAPEDIQGDSTYFSLAVSHPLIRSRRENLTLSGLFDYRNSTTDIFTNQLLNEDRIRAIRLSGAYSFQDRGAGFDSFYLEASQGLNVFNATETGSPNLSRADGHSDFTKFDAQISRQQDLADVLPGFQAVVSAGGQISAVPLLAPEQFGLGGLPFGRAYDPSEIVGDDGAAGSLELDYSRAAPLSWQPLLQSYQFFGYVDGGYVWNLAPAAGEAATESLMSAGGGMRFDLLGGITGSLEGDIPLTRVVATEGNRDARVFFSLTGRF